MEAYRRHADEVAFYQWVRKGLRKTIPGTKLPKEAEQAVHDLLDESIASEEAVDIFKAAGLSRPDISILDETFLEEFNWERGMGAGENLRVRLLEKLLLDEIQARRRKNLLKYQSFKAKLEGALQRYHNNLMSTAEIVQILIEIRQAII